MTMVGSSGTTVPVNAGVASLGHCVIDTRYVTVDANVTTAVRHGIPLAIPRSQLYYWSSTWQDNEAEALAELARGEGREFASTEDAIRWLLDPSDD